MQNLYRIFKKLNEKLRYNFSSEYREFLRIKNIPRFTPTTTILLGKKIKIVDSITYLNGFKEIFKKDIYEFKSEASTPFIIDCGSNIGLSIIYFKNLFSNAKIIGFEPDPNIYKVLEHNIEIFNFENIEVFQKAIWTEKTTLSFQLEGGASGRIQKPGDTDRIINVETVSLSGLLENKVVDFLKIDIEGAEYEVLKSCKDKLSNVKHLFIEYHSHEKEEQTLHEILQILSNNGFRYHVQEAYTRQKPYIDTDVMLDMDLQLNIFGYRV